MTHDSDGAAVAAAEEDNELDAQRVASYLRRHPDFLARNADLLKETSAKHGMPREFGWRGECWLCFFDPACRFPAGVRALGGLRVS